MLFQTRSVIRKRENSIKIKSGNRYSMCVEAGGFGQKVSTCLLGFICRIMN